MIRVVLVDDQALLRAGFRALVDAEDDMSVVGEASGGVEAVEVVRAINGATDGRKAAPGTIRGDLSLSNR